VAISAAICSRVFMTVGKTVTPSAPNAALVLLDPGHLLQSARMHRPESGDRY
jgi:hypothetical protein